MSEDEARRLFRQLIVALDFCTRMGVSNHDVRLENTLLDQPCAGTGNDAVRTENSVAAGTPRKHCQPLFLSIRANRPSRNLS